MCWNLNLFFVIHIMCFYQIMTYTQPTTVLEMPEEYNTPNLCLFFSFSSATHVYHQGVFWFTNYSILHFDHNTFLPFFQKLISANSALQILREYHYHNSSNLFLSIKWFLLSFLSSLDTVIYPLKDSILLPSEVFALFCFYQTGYQTQIGVSTTCVLSFVNTSMT